MSATSRPRDSTTGTRGSLTYVVFAAVVGLQLVLAVSAALEGAGAFLATLAPLYVALSLAVGYHADRLRSDSYLFAVCAGWALLMGVRYAVAPATGDAVIGALAAALAVYYAVNALRDDGDNGGEGDEDGAPSGGPTNP